MGSNNSDDKEKNEETIEQRVKKVEAQVRRENFTWLTDDNTQAAIYAIMVGRFIKSPIAIFQFGLSLGLLILLFFNVLKIGEMEYDVTAEIEKKEKYLISEMVSVSEKSKEKIGSEVSKEIKKIAALNWKGAIEAKIDGIFDSVEPELSKSIQQNLETFNAKFPERKLNNIVTETEGTSKRLNDLDGKLNELSTKFSDFDRTLASLDEAELQKIALAITVSQQMEGWLLAISLFIGLILGFSISTFIVSLKNR